MTDQWNFYLCTVNDKLASIYLNLGLANEAPVLSKPYLLWVWVYLKSPRPDGLTTNQEAQVMYKIEDELSAQLASSSEAQLAGNITTQSRREFYFYGATETNFKPNVTAAFQAFPTYEFSIGTKRDESFGAITSRSSIRPLGISSEFRITIFCTFSQGKVMSMPCLVGFCTGYILPRRNPEPCFERPSSTPDSSAMPYIARKNRQLKNLLS